MTNNTPNLKEAFDAEFLHKAGHEDGDESKPPIHCVWHKHDDLLRWIEQFVDSEISKRDNHARVVYSPYVDTFHFYDTCVENEPKPTLRRFDNKVNVHWAIDEKGEIMHLEIKSLHTGATELKQEGEEHA